MKKLTALLLALAMCLSLAACASAPEVSEDQKALEAANALMEAGDYQAAINAYYEIPMYQEISAKLNEAFNQIVASKAGPYVGTWIELRSGISFTVNADGTMLVTEADGTTYDAMLSYDGDDIYIYGSVVLTEIDGIPHLKDEYYDFVPADAYDSLAAQTVEITLENWETYFELREAKRVQYNNLGELDFVSMGYGVFLRDEYVQKLESEWGSVSATFKLQFDFAHFYIEGDYPDGEYTLGEQFVDSAYDYAAQEHTRDIGLYDFVDPSMVSDFDGYYAADFAVGHVSDWDNVTQSERYNAYVPVNPQVLEVAGTLRLFP